MTIETKYNIGDEVWVKRKGQASEGIIVSLTAFADCLYDFKTHKPHSHLSSIIYTIGFPKDAEALGDWVRPAYSIGELIEMLPKHTDDSDILHIEAYDSIGWDVWYGFYCNGDEVSVEYSAENKELIDALYDMIIKLKEEGVI